MERRRLTDFFHNISFREFGAQQAASSSNPTQIAAGCSSGETRGPIGARPVYGVHRHGHGAKPTEARRSTDKVCTLSLSVRELTPFEEKPYQSAD
jgi:hypothetical protein